MKRVDWGNTPAAQVQSFSDLIAQAEQEAEARATSITRREKPLAEQVAALAARWGARVTA
jgi:histidinol dehydrogenase